jgi:outer membrane receptor for Fe3+-dicitrate
MKRLLKFSALVFCVLLLSNCASQSSGSSVRAEPEAKGYDQYASLYQALRSIPGVRVSGSESSPNIILRGGGAGGVDNVQPLFILDNVVLGSNYAQVNAVVLPTNIASIKILNGLAATNRYGQEGRGGVILIKTKTSNR